MNKLYSVEFAVKAKTEFLAMERLRSFGISKADEAKLSDLDRQADLFIIKAIVNESELTDECYEKLLASKDIFILSDELSASRAKQVIDICNVVERQIKKLLICVIPEISEVIEDIIDMHQKHKSKLKPTDNIEWCKKINDFSFGELPKVLNQDVSEIAKKKLLSSEGLLSMIISAEDFNTLKANISDISKPKTVWNSINSILEKPVEYSFFSSALKDLCGARDDAVHLNVITAKRLVDVEKNQKHVMTQINTIKSKYRENLKVSMESLAKSMSFILESTKKIDPLIFATYQDSIQKIFKPLNDTIVKLNLNMIMPRSTDLEELRQNTDYFSQVAKSLLPVFENIKSMDEYNEFIKQARDNSFSEMTSRLLIDTKELKVDLHNSIEEQKNGDTK